MSAHNRSRHVFAITMHPERFARHSPVEAGARNLEIGRAPVVFTGTALDANRSHTSFRLVDDRLSCPAPVNVTGEVDARLPSHRKTFGVEPALLVQLGRSFKCSLKS